jgi:hypothetical protein
MPSGNMRKNMDKTNCIEAGAGSAVCDHCAEGRLELCRYMNTVGTLKSLEKANRLILSIAITHPHLIPWETEITHEQY